MLNVVFAQCNKKALYAECHIQALYAECHYAECHGALKYSLFLLINMVDRDKGR